MDFYTTTAVVRCAMASDRFAFEAEWFDRFSSMTRKFTIVYYEREGTVEVRGWAGGRGALVSRGGGC